MRNQMLAAIAAVLIAGPAMAGGLYNNPAAETNGVWRPGGFEQRVDRARFMEEVKGGAYDQWQVTNNYGPTVIEKMLSCQNQATGTASQHSQTGNSGGNNDINASAPNFAPVDANQVCIAK